jgi:hypothetical protein
MDERIGAGAVFGRRLGKPAGFREGAEQGR